MPSPALVTRAAVIKVAIATPAVGLAAAPAQAATTVSNRAVGGDRQITAAWGTVAKATGYTVHWGKGTSTAHVLHTTGTTIRINGVANRTTYSVRVTANGVAASSKRVTATPSPYAPTPITSVKAVPAGPNRIRVSWTGGGRARSIAVMAGADSQTKTFHFASAWHPAALSSWTLTIPPSRRGVLGAGTGNAIFVRVVQTNSTAANPAMGYSFNGTTKFRLSDVGPWTIAGAAPVTASTSHVTIGSWNVQSISASARYSRENRWDARLPKVVANVEDLHPDAIGFQELGTSYVDPTCRNPHVGVFACEEQYQTLQSALGTASSTVTTTYRNVRPDANAYKFQQDQAGNDNFVDSAIFYNPAKVQLVDSGFLSPRAIVGAAWPKSYQDEAGVWAVLRTIATPTAPARSFLMASIHMPASGSNVSTVRRAEGAELATWLDAKAKAEGGLPVVLTGDFNADGVTDGNAANLRLIADGYHDAAATANRNSIRWCTSNLTNGPDGTDPGYPEHAAPHPHWASRIDYIMLKGAVSTRYRNEIRLTGSLFDTRYQGSDHNLQLASIGIQDPGLG